MFYKKGALKNLAKFTGNHPFMDLFLMKLKVSIHQLYWKKAPIEVFSDELKTIF